MVLCLSFVSVASVPQACRAETLETALGRAYSVNPALNAQRAELRAVDENVAIAKSGYRPRVTANAILAENKVDLGRPFSTQTFGITANQTLYDGFQTLNATRQAETQVLGSREDLRFTETTILLSAAQTYMGVLFNTASLELQRDFVTVLQEQLRQTRERFALQEVTTTDIAQGEARLAGARSSVSLAESALRTSIASYRQIIGVDPALLAPGRPLDRFVPTSLSEAINRGLADHPSISSAYHAVDFSEAQVKILEGQLQPRAAVTGSIQQNLLDFVPSSRSGSLVGGVTIPIYEGGLIYAQIRQAKETVAQTRISVETVRDTVRAGITDAWGVLEAAKANVIATQAQVLANEVALAGVREEALAGQRTTLDILNAHQELLTARLDQIRAQRDRVLGTYLLLQSIGRLSARNVLGRVALYNPKIHYDQIKNLWAGLNNPDGR